MGPTLPPVMKMWEEVAIVTDRANVGLAKALRGVLEGFDLNVRYYELVQRRQATALFAAGGPPTDWTVLFAHGFSHDDDCGVRFEVRDNPSEDPRAVEGWYVTHLDLTPATIPEIVKGVHGTYITNACGGGDRRLAAAFLDAGCDSYVGSTEPYIDTDAGMLFLIGLFHFLVTGSRDYAPKCYSLSEAVSRAQALHGDWKQGTQGFCCYPA